MTDQPAYLNTDLPFAERAADLIHRMTLEEKIGQVQHNAPAIERLGIPPYNWWNECLHGVGRAGTATVFPQAIGLAAMWNAPFLHELAAAIGDEARAKHHQALREQRHQQYYGLTFWTPTINIFRDPRWGRGQETYGEDPYLTARLGVAFITGLQGDDPRYLKVAACAKHYAVHSGPEDLRHEFNAEASPKDLRETYLPAFEAAVREAHVEAVMAAYNRTNGEACCASPTLLQAILREEWGFGGHVVSDCAGIEDLYKTHRIVETPEEAAAAALNAGCDLNCGSTYRYLRGALAQGLVSEAALDQSLRRLLMARLRLGMFDPPEQVAYAQIPYEVNDCAAHRALALQAARESLVLLKNADNILPLNKETLGTLAVIGPNAHDPEVLLGNYNGIPSVSVTPLEGIRRAVNPATRVLYARGCLVAGEDTGGYGEALDAAQQADVVIFVGGLSQWLEGEEGEHASVPPGERKQSDRPDLDLPEVQENLLKALHATGKPLILVLMNGGALAINWAAAHLPAILEAWYPGEEGGTAIADALFGAYNPAGRLPVTFYRTHQDLPPFTDYSMAGRTYRYFEGEALYPFGYGLSYTTFAYDNLTLSAATLSPDETVTIQVDVRNTGARDGDEVAQLYTRWPLVAAAPRCQLNGFARTHIPAGETRRVAFELTPQQLSVAQADGQRILLPGPVEVWVGGGQPGSTAPGLLITLDIQG